MKKSFAEEQTIGFLREAEAGLAVAERVKELETENGRLKRLLAEAMLENKVTKEALRKKWRAHLHGATWCAIWSVMG